MYDRSELELANDKFLTFVQNDKVQYFSLLLTMAKFHKYSLKQQIGLCLHAPKNFTACATAKQWEKFYGRKIIKSAKGVPLIEDKPSENGIRIVYDLENTFSDQPEKKKPDLLWRYDDKKDGRLIHELVDGDAETPAKVIYLCKKLAEKSAVPAQNFVATNTAYVVLKRLGYDPQVYLKTELEKISLQNQDIFTGLTATNKLSKQVLNPIGAYIKNERRNQNGQQYENPLLRSLGKIEGTVPAERTAEEIPGYDANRNIAAVSTGDRGRLQQKVLEFGESVDGTGTGDGGIESEKSDGMGTESEQHPIESPRAIDGGNLPVEHKQKKIVVKGGYKKQVFQKNLAAICALKQLESENREASPEERVVLQGYAGFGGLPEAFDATQTTWENEYQALKNLLTEEEYHAARASTLTAHFTDDIIVKSMYQGLKSLGFEQGSILEPSCGTGRFFADMPADMSENSSIYGVELDSLTGRMTQKIYPKTNISIQGFETTKFANNSFDLAIGNVPFGEYKVNDPAYQKENFLIHDYFLAKMMDQVRSGGLAAVITSKGTMDKKDPKVREYLARRGELVKAIRLPNNAFKAAGTEVTADILFLKKREKMLEEGSVLPSWVESKAWNEEGLTVNSYFLEHPEDVMGQLERKSTAFGFTVTCKPNEDKELWKQLQEAVSSLTTSYQAREGEVILPTQETESVVKCPFSFFIQQDKLYYQTASQEEEITGLSSAQQEQIRACIRVRNLVRDVIEAQKNGDTDEAVQALQQRLNAVYDRYTQKYGRIAADKGLKKIFEQDASYPLLCSLEIYKDKKFVGKSDIFFKRTINPYITPDHADTAADALTISMQEKGKVDLPYMESLTNISHKRIVRELEFTSIYYDWEKKEYQLADEYLSGDIRGKIEFIENLSHKLEKQKEELLRTIGSPPTELPVYIRDIISELDSIEKNRKALEAVKPNDLEPSEIQIELGATWIPTEDVRNFLFETLGTGYATQQSIDVHYSDVTGTWRIDGKSSDYGNPKAEMTYGLKEINAYSLVELALNLKEAKIYKTIYVDGNEKRVIDKETTILAQQKQEILKTEFSKWIWKDPARRERLAAYYNRYFNNIRPREYSGKYLKFPGMNCEITLRDHQKDAIAHTLYGGNTLLAHCVGAGKTYEMVASIMEAKRLGISKKAMVVVPKHLTEQFGAEFLRLYPAANILVATRKDFETANRKEFCSKIATHDWDAVIMGYTQFEKIPISKERMTRLLEKQIDEIIEGINEVTTENGEHFTIKQMELQRKKLEARLDALQENNTDQTLVFEDLGIDRLYVDEAHYFKNLFTATKMQNIPGITTTDAKKTTDLYEKCQYLNEKTHSKGIVFATGTPVSNSMTELFTMQRYLQPSRLESEGLTFFDKWASTFGKTVTAVELSPEGKGFRSKTRFAKFHNLPELMSMFKEIADIKTPDMLKLPVPEAEHVVNRIEPTEEQEEMVDHLAERAERIRSGGVSPDVDNMLLIINEGRKLALDPRLIDESLPDNPDSKVNQCVNTVYDIYQKTAEKKSTQMIFCDLSTPTYGKGFSVYDDIKAKLIAKGMAEKEIAFIHDAKNEKQKDALFARVRSGEVRVLLGSTAMMGTGTNVQDKLIALHDLDVPWRPSDLEQRRGRIVRQGNENPKVQIFRYVTEGTFDAYLWQIIENKQRFISQIMTSKSPVRSAEDVDEATLSYAEIKAIATGNPLIKEKMDIDIQLEKLKMAKAEYLSNQHRLEHLISDDYPKKIAKYEDQLARFQEDQAFIDKHTVYVEDEEAFSIVLNGVRFEDRKEAGEILLEAVQNGKSREITGEYKGMTLELVYDISQGKQLMVLSHALSYRTELSHSAIGNMMRLDHLVNNLSEDIEHAATLLSHAKENFEAAKKEVHVAFAQEEEFKIKLLRAKELESLLNLDSMSEINKVSEKEKRIQNILDFSSDKIEDQVECAFKTAACHKLKKSKGKWNDYYDERIGTYLLKKGYSKDEVVNALFKFSPRISNRENITLLIGKAEQKTICEICR
ncbi:MAG: SNF2-related protein [Smithella sp.]